MMGRVIHVISGIGVDSIPDLPPDGVLLNTPGILKTMGSLREGREIFRLAKERNEDIVFMCDSGGKQLFDAERDVDTRIIFDRRMPIESRKKGLKLFNLCFHHPVRAALLLSPQVPHIIFSTDRPVGPVIVPAQRDWFFMQCFTYNLWSAKETIHLRDIYCPTVLVFVPLQAYSPAQAVIFLRMIRNLKYDGVALPTRNFNFRHVALFFLLFYIYGIRQVHLFGTEGFGNICVLCYFAAIDMFDFISFDATSWRAYAHYEGYMVPDLRARRIKEGFFSNMTWPVTCPCPSCTPFNTFGELMALPYLAKHHLFSMHNFYVLQTFKNACFSHALDGISAFEDFLRTVSPARAREIDGIIRIINLVESVKDNITEDGLHALWATMCK